MKTISGLAQIQCTTLEAAAVLGISEHTFLNFVAKGAPGHELWHNGKGQGKAALRRTQMQLAGRNAAMAIFLGKNLLDQKDRQEIEHSGTMEVNTNARARLEHSILRHTEPGGEGGSISLPDRRGE